MIERQGNCAEGMSDDEEEYIYEANPEREVDLVRLLRRVVRTSSRLRSEVLKYDGNSNA